MNVDKNCNICTESYNKSSKQCVECICEFKSCRMCIKEYINSRNEEAHCMSCKKIWTWEFMSKNMEKVYVSKVYKTHREKFLVEKEISKLPESQVFVEEQIKKEKKESEMKKVSLQIQELCKKLNELRFNTENTAEATQKREFIKPCPQNSCRGFLSTALKCGTCEKFACSKCKEPKNENHVCDENILENIKGMEKDCKGCPGCGKMIYKIEGCSQMYCTPEFGGCSTVFDWITMKKNVGLIHNPHYFEWQRKNGNGNVERTPGDIPCGRIIDHYFVQRLSSSSLRTIGINLLHIIHIEIQRYTVNVNDNLDLRINYIRNKINKDELKKLVQKRDKANQKKKMYQIF